MKTVNLGLINGPLVGLAMKEMVRRATELIHAKRFFFEASAKPGPSGEMDDVVTNADQACQRMYAKLLAENFPGVGIIAEEEDLRVECNIPGHEIFFTIDPLDGTKAFVRNQSHGIGTMISLVCDGKVIAAYVGDVMSKEIYGFRPDSDKTHRITNDGVAVELSIDTSRPLSRQYALLRKSLEKHHPFTRRMLRDGFLFLEHEITGGSIGCSMARLWKSEVGAAILQGGRQTPWDSSPVNGISRRLGFVFIPLIESRPLRVVEPVISSTTQMMHSETLVVHSSRLVELQEVLGRDVLEI